MLRMMTIRKLKTWLLVMAWEYDVDLRTMYHLDYDTTRYRRCTCGPTNRCPRYHQHFNEWKGWLLYEVMKRRGTLGQSDD